MTTNFVVNFLVIPTLPANNKPQKLIITGNLPSGFEMELVAYGGFENVYMVKFKSTPTQYKVAKVKVSYPCVYFYRCLDFMMAYDNGWSCIFNLPTAVVERQTLLTFTFYN